MIKNLEILMCLHDSLTHSFWKIMHSEGSLTGCLPKAIYFCDCPMLDVPLELHPSFIR